MSKEDYINQEKILGDNPRIKILNTTIDVLTEQQTVDLVEKYVLRKEPLHLIGVNADKINSLNSNPRIAKIVNSCGVINADGASVVLASKILNVPLPERVAGIDLMQKLIRLSAKKNYSVYFLGAKKRIVEKTAEVIQGQYPELNIVGVHDGYINESEWMEISRELNEVHPDFIFVGITSPLKEYLVEFLQSKGNRGVFMGVGGSFDVISGMISRAPIWMQKMNLEWLYRVIQEPKRLFKRYLVGNVKFIKNVIKEKVS
ncbi:WecB/TagA/CpsF family glycosyltransferase [Pediococcus inopinatus]|uniref:WecB/TagA/CpsF family glycosyltransferase n=1 Tax=Pediococcus inopinatus TaxID=114090 RepID=UPI002B260BC8|nr:WecB/TagA/CpsF family glycosyltransferase [Pediococcus inopinatus]WPC17395.1 WecB/TagA/CpsF family glycosyltransferase [Pediococcus inopinatus]